ncbi:LemA family protein [Teredinibacter sp. KSP-S5-2]|uniref:LemA family protein n=1 Tax=Teredinibacter sp. KSP-S5-2 TaxID=3034506 RepID=UPI002934A64C|nr:LemA family protein [Teredinibacter sp. KSP-S5-2]WNO08298.1 LemA family protein [Teredinibacter sp. KSP-S5-2]
MDIFWIVAAVVIVSIYLWYVSIVTKKNRALEALSGIDVQLKQRSNLIPNILTIAQKFMDHEKALLSEVTRLRTAAISDYDVNDSSSLMGHLQAAGQLDSAMGKLMVAVEAYPDLKSDSTMLHAQQTYNEVEANIAAARRFYNTSVTELNNSIQIFPGNLIAGLAKASTMPFYEVDEVSKAPVSAGDFLK